MTLDLEIQRLLRTEEVRKINFSMAGICVSGRGFYELSDCFSDHPIRHRIRVTVRPQLVGPNADAAYDPENDKINLRSPSVLQTVSGRGNVIHECTHAQIDLRAISTPIRSEEAAAFIAEALYYLSCNEDIPTVSPGFPLDVVGIAANLREQALQSPGIVVALTADQINLAREAMAQFGYRSGHYFSNGIRGHRYRGD